jgi:hypothetical protein
MGGLVVNKVSEELIACIYPKDEGDMFLEMFITDYVAS